MPCHGDADQRWLRHPEPSSWSLKSARKKKLLSVLSLAKKYDKTKLVSFRLDKRFFLLYTHAVNEIFKKEGAYFGFNRNAQIT